MKAGKAPGCDPSITAEALKHGGEPVVEALHQICNAVFTRKIPPSQWIRNIILPLPKKGSLYEMSHTWCYRCINFVFFCSCLQTKGFLQVLCFFSLSSKQKPLNYSFIWIQIVIVTLFKVEKHRELSPSLPSWRFL